MFSEISKQRNYLLWQDKEICVELNVFFKYKKIVFQTVQE